MLGPIFRTLLKSKLGATLIVLQIAMTVAILANVVAVVKDRLVHISADSGLPESELASFVANALDPDSDPLARLESERAALAQIPGIASISAANAVPLSGSGWSFGVRAQIGPKAKDLNVANYFGAANLVETWGATIIAGRNFDPREIEVLKNQRVDPAVTLISETTAKTLFPEGNAVGKRVTYRGDATDLGTEVIGVISDFARPWTNWGEAGAVVITPYIDGGGSYQLIIRANAGEDARAVAQAARDHLAKSFRDRVYGEKIETLGDMRKRAYRSDVALTALISSFALLLVGVTVLGMVGLATFWVNQRTRTIGVRRALGARRIDIERYFRTENLLLTVIGGGLGLLLAYALNYGLSKHAGMDMLPVWPALLGILMLVGVGQLAVTWPARTASRIPPALATRAA